MTNVTLVLPKWAAPDWSHCNTQSCSLELCEQFVRSRRCQCHRGFSRPFSTSVILGAGEGGKHLNKECLWKWPLVILAHTSSKAAIVFLLVKQQSSSRWGFFLSPCSIMLAFMCPPGPHPAVWWASTQMYCSGSHIPGRSNAPAPHQLHICNC